MTHYTVNYSKQWLTLQEQHKKALDDIADYMTVSRYAKLVRDLEIARDDGWQPSREAFHMMLSFAALKVITLTLCMQRFGLMVKFSKRGVIRFLRIGRLNIQWSIKRANTGNNGAVSWTQQLSRASCFCHVSSQINHGSAQLRVGRLWKRAKSG